MALLVMGMVWKVTEIVTKMALLVTETVIEKISISGRDDNGDAIVGSGCIKG